MEQPQKNQTKDKVREIYEKSGLSYTELSALIGVNRSTLARWLNGTRTPSHISLEYLSNKVNEYLTNKEKA